MVELPSFQKNRGEGGSGSASNAGAGKKHSIAEEVLAAANKDAEKALAKRRKKEAQQGRAHHNDQDRQQDINFGPNMDAPDWMQLQDWMVAPLGMRRHNPAARHRGRRGGRRR